MKYYYGMPIGLWFIAISNIIFTIYYYIRPFLWVGDVSIYAPMLSLTPWGLFMWFNTILEIIGIYAVTFGFYYTKNWARLFTIFFFFLPIIYLPGILFDTTVFRFLNKKRLGIKKSDY